MAGVIVNLLLQQPLMIDLCEAVFKKLKVIIIDLAIILPLLALLSLTFPHTAFAQESGKRIEVNLNTQMLYAYQGNQLIYSFLISSGRWLPTPTGNFAIYYKTPFDHMKGGNPALGTAYDLYNVPDVMYFAGGNALHGAYWHSNFGQPMSHGCINEPLADAHMLYNWAPVGTPVNVY